ncbi:SUMF1/EgtB/PvdO family nonheme iron enzyme [Desmonostoc muscorum CCALA 125]|nr:SUMF1/EgtB/PvdO family nonheme iron enzyme [Desmonostoc muscorum CCALA 125]
MGLSIKSFTALLLNLPDLSQEKQENLLPFAHVAAEVLRNLGGKYADFAEEIETNKLPKLLDNNQPIFQLFAGEYICAVKWGGETGIWHEGTEHLIIYPQGEVQLRSRFGLAVIQNLTVQDKILSWSFDDNQTAASITFQVNSENSYFWEDNQTGKLFEGWLNYPNEGIIDFRGRFEETLNSPPFQVFEFEVANINLQPIDIRSKGKLALLIGVSEYQPGLAPQPNAVKNVEAMRRVLVDPFLGGFAEGDVTVLKNPQKQEIEEAIYNLFSNRHKDDLLLFYFSGHGIQDDTGQLYLSTPATKIQNGKLVKPSAVAASFLHEGINDSRSQRQVLILDSCFSRAITQGMTLKSDPTVNVQEQLGGKGRAILTSSSSTQYSFEQEGSELSIYTRYLVQGIETGAADKDSDGWISIDELHEYASTKVLEAAPAMTPKFYPVEEGHKILLAKSAKDDPKLKYRKEVENRINQGNFSGITRLVLNSLRLQLKLTPEVADAIEAEVQQPYREYQRKLEEYEVTLVEAIAHEATLSEITLNDLRDYQQHLGLRDEDVASIEERIIGQQKPTVAVEPKPVSPEQNPANQFELVVNRTQKTAQYYVEDLGNGITLEMVLIPEGSFVMGSPEDELERMESESPQHLVNIKQFCIGKYPVTQAQWKAVVALPQVNKKLDVNPSKSKEDQRPVESVSWYDAVEFCSRLARHTKRQYRLPSEAEWEYACRAGTTTPFHFGETITTDFANYRGTDDEEHKSGSYGRGPKGIYREETTEVGGFGLANAFGLYDMHGNIQEWCLDDWHHNYEGAPTDGSAWFNNNLSEKQGDAVLRGGSWVSRPSSCRSAYRRNFVRDIQYISNGFRVVFTAQ